MCEECSPRSINSNWTSECNYECHDGFSSENCDRCSGDYFCSEAGSCSVVDGSATCICDPGFTGNACQHCDVNIHCTSSRQSVGCKAKKRFVFCECSRNYTFGFWGGEKCRHCDKVHSCGNGISEDTTCKYEGDRLVCTNCSVRFTGDRCRDCATGFTGEDCDECAPGYYPTSGAMMCQHFCDPLATCNGHGTCGSEGNCICQEGWSGADCKYPCWKTFPGLDQCPNNMPYLIAKNFASRECKGDCEDCTTQGGWRQYYRKYLDNVNHIFWPKCEYADNKSWRLSCFCRKCWAAPHICEARPSDVIGVGCAPEDIRISVEKGVFYPGIPRWPAAC
jgi:hypothetical protein